MCSFEGNISKTLYKQNVEILGEGEIGRLKHEAGDPRELYSGEFESEES